MGDAVSMEPGSFRTWLERGGVLAAFPRDWELTEITQVNDHTVELHVAREGESLCLRVARRAAVPGRWLCESRNFKACYVGKDLRRPDVVARILKALLAQDGPDLEVRDRPEPERVERVETEPTPVREPSTPSTPSTPRQSALFDELFEIPVFDVELTARSDESRSHGPPGAPREERARMSDAVIEALLRFVPERAFVSFAGIGRPLLHPRLFDLIREIRRTGERRIDVMADGSLLTSEVVDRLVADPPDDLYVVVHRARGQTPPSPSLQAVEAVLPRLRGRMNVVEVEDGPSPVALAGARTRWRAGVTVVSWNGDVLACCEDVAGPVRLGDVTVDSYSSVVRLKRGRIQRGEWPARCATCDARRGAPLSFVDAHPRAEITAGGPWVTRDGGFPLGRFHANVLAAGCAHTRRLADGTFSFEVLEDGVRAVLDRAATRPSVLIAGDANIVVLQAHALRRFGRPVPMVAFVMSAAAVLAADRFIERAEGESVLRRLGDMPWILFNQNDLDRLGALGVPASARHFGTAGTYLLRTLAEGMSAVLDAPPQTGSGVFAGGRSHRDYATLAAAAPALGAPLHVVGAPEHAALFQGVEGVTFQAGLDVTAFHRAMARARVVVVPIEWTQSSAGHLTISAAQMMGKPVVATRVPGLAGYIDHGLDGILVPPGEPGALAQAIRALLDDDALAHRLGEAGRAAELARCAKFEDLLLGFAESALRARLEDDAPPMEEPPMETHRAAIPIRLVLAGAARPPDEGGTTTVPAAPWLLPAGPPELPSPGGIDALRAYDRPGAVRLHTGRDIRVLATELFEESAYEALLSEATTAGASRVHCLHALRYLWAARFAAAEGFGRDSRVVDVGCGVGYGCAILRRAFDDVTGLDFDPAAIELARRHWGAALGNASRLVVADLLALAEAPSPWAGGAHLVTCFECIEHLVDPVRGMRALRHLMAPDGLLLASVPFNSYRFHTVLFTCEEDVVRLAKTAFRDVRVLRQEETGRISAARALAAPSSYLLVCRA